MAVTQSEIDSTILLSEGMLTHWVIAASKQDAFGNWEQALCFMDRAEESAQKIGVLETNCDVDISEFVNENTSKLICDINEDTGIGKWAIKPSVRGCNIFKIRGGQLPPPYGEFTQDEFVVAEVTEVELV